MRYTPERPAGHPVQRRRQPVHEEPADRRVDRGDRLVPGHRLGRSGRADGREPPQGQPGLRRGPLPDARVRGPDGQKRTALEITADNIVNLERRGREEATAPSTRPALRAASPARRPPDRPVPRPVRAATTPSSTTCPSDLHRHPTAAACGPPNTRNLNADAPQTRSKKRDDYYRDRRRRKVCAFCADKTVQIDYKEVNRLRRYLSERAKIEPRRKTGTCAGHQRELAVALKRARHVALLPYAPQHLRP